MLPGSDFLQFREDFVHDNIVQEGLRAVLCLAFFLFCQDGQFPEVFLHHALRANEAAELLRLGAAQGGSALQDAPRRADGGMGLPAEAAGDAETVLFTVEIHQQGGFAAGALNGAVGGLQGKNGPGGHNRPAALGAEISEGPHFFHGIHLFCKIALSRGGPEQSLIFILYHRGDALYSIFWENTALFFFPEK